MYSLVKRCTLECSNFRYSSNIEWAEKFHSSPEENLSIFNFHFPVKIWARLND